MTDVAAKDLTFEERYQILRRLRFWGDLFAQFAEERIGGYEELKAHTASLEEKKFLPLEADSADKFERVLMNERDAVKLWRYARAADNHRITFLERTLELFPDKKEKLKYFYVVSTEESTKEKRTRSAMTD